MSALGVDICVVRHSEVDYSKQRLIVELFRPLLSMVVMVQATSKSVFAGLDDHIYEEFGTFENLKICIAGDITYSRG